MARLPTTQPGLTSLGAVGGARGTAAGAIRILVEFLTQYDSKAVQQLEADLAALGATDANIAKQQLSAQRAAATLERRRAATQKEIRRFVSSEADKPAAIRRQLTEIKNVGVLTNLGQERLRNLSLQVDGSEHLLRLVTDEANQTRALAAAQTRVANATKQRRQSGAALVAQEQQLTRFQQLRANLGPKLGGLALGALGGIVGGAVLGVGFAAAEAGLAAVGEKLQDIFDPARKAREELEGMGQAIRKLAEESGGDLEKAAGAFLSQFGIASDENTRKLLAEAAGIQFANEQLKQRIALFQLLQHIETLRTESVRALAAQLAREAGDTQAALAIEDARYQGRLNQARLDPFLSAAELQLAGAQQAASDAAAQAKLQADALTASRNQQAAAAQLAAFAEENLVSAIQAAAGVRIGQFDARIQSLQGGGPSARTRGLEAQIEKLQNAGNGGQDRGRQQELANIAEERAIILLRQRLRLMGTQIDLERYSGKFLLEAINAKLKALQKEAAAQDRLNKLLDLQFRMSQKMRRNEGESINDFIERRAQENRDLLSEQRDLEREAVEERLQELQEKTQDEVALQELSERKKNALVKSGTDNRIGNLQKELAKSREADRRALQSKIEAIEKAKKAYAAAAANAAHYATETANAQIREAIRASIKITDLAKLTGQVSGLSAAREFLSALLASGAVTGEQARAIQGAISNIDASLNAFEKKRSLIIARAGHTPGTRGLRNMAGGGVIRLSNASTPFGSNVQFGEQGSEAAVILQHKIAEGLKGMQGIGEQNFYLQKGDDWQKDKFYMKRLVKEAVSEVLR